MTRIERGEACAELPNLTGARPLDAEAVLLSTGWLGNLAPLNLDAAGVETERHYVRVDSRLRTTASHIFAAGDITGREVETVLLRHVQASRRIRILEHCMLGAQGQA